MDGQDRLEGADTENRPRRHKMKNPISTTHLIAVAVVGGAFATGFFSGPAFAATEPEQETVPFEFKFSYQPSELTSAPKAEKLVGRLERAVRRECADGDRKIPVSQRAQVQACVNETMRSSIARFGSEAVAQAYKSRAAG